MTQVPAAPTAPTAPTSRVSVDVPATPVRAGEPFTLVLRTRVPLGTTVAFPVGPDSGVVEAVESAQSETRPAGPDSVDARAVYRLIAWETGERTIPFGAAVFETGGTAERVAVGRVALAVESVLPGEGTPDPKPARPPRDLPTPWVRDALLVTLALLVGALLVWWAMRRGRGVTVVPPRRRADPLAALDALAALGLDGAGEPTRVLLGAADAVRDALTQAHPASRVRTTEELARTALSGVPMPRVVSLLEDADRARYGGTTVTPDRARRALAEARVLVQGLAGAGVADRVGAAR